MRNHYQSKMLKSFRESLNLTLSEFSQLLGDTTISSSYEQGRYEPHVHTFLRWRASAKQHGIELSESLFFPEVKKEYQINSVAYTLKEFREYFNCSQQLMAKELGIAHRTYIRYENGESNLLITTFCKIREYGRERGIELLFPKMKEMEEQRVIHHQKQELMMCRS